MEKIKKNKWQLRFFVVMSAMMLSLAISSVSVFAAPMFDVPMTVLQPDGTYLDAYVSGDRFFNYLHDSDGRVIVQHPETGFWVYAELDKDGILVASNRVALNDGFYFEEFVINNILRNEKSTIYNNLCGCNSPLPL